MSRLAQFPHGQLRMQLAILLGIGVAVWAAPPETINVHGSLMGPDGMPLAGTRAYVVRFFDAEMDGTQLGGNLTGVLQVSSDGLFNLPVPLPPEALAVSALWYELGIDSDNPTDGNANDDLFPERIRVHSVPFALEAGEVAHLDALRIGGGAVDDTEFAYLDGLMEPLQTALDTKADDADLTAHAGDTANPHAVTKVQVGLGNVDNTADTDKPVSTATQAALDLKADDADLTAHAGDTANPHAVTKVQVGLGNVDNTADADKPVSTATQTALNAKANVAALVAHVGDIGNPHAVTAPEVGLGNVNNTSDADKPVSTATQAALDLKLPTASEAYVVVEVTSDAAANGINLFDAYAAAEALTPFGSALSATNRAVVLVPPGNYELDAVAVLMDTDFVDLAGLSTVREDQYIYRADNVLVQTASDVRIENLVFHYTGTNVAQYAYLPDVTWDDGTSHTGSPPETHIRNCEFRASERSMRTIAEYAGIYEDCIAGNYAFGGYYGKASGTFANCTGGHNAFGGYNGTASGTFTKCTGGYSAFGGIGGEASGTFINCTGGDCAFGCYYGMTSGTFNNCTGGSYAFGGDHGTASGKFTNCTGGSSAFGGDVGVASGTFTNCIGDDDTFGGGTASGTFTNCTGGNYSFGGNSGTTTVGSFYGCRMTGTSYEGTFQGRMENCRWGTGFTCAAEARVYRSTILGNVDLNSTTAGIAHSAVKGTIQNAGSASFNTGNLEDTDVN